jgi:hypothetical protein
MTVFQREQSPFAADGEVSVAKNIMVNGSLPRSEHNKPGFCAP